MSAIAHIAALLAVGFMTVGCASSSTKRAPFDYSAYVERDPRSVVVAPVVGTQLTPTIEQEFLTTVTQPLAERGYYVFPVQMSKSVAAEAGITGRGPSGGFLEFSAESATQIAEVFAADSVLFVKIRQWDTRREAAFRVDPPETSTVMISYLLASDTGKELWSAQQTIAYTEAGSANFVTAIFKGLWKMMVGTFMTAEERQTQLARESNRTAIQGQQHKIGLRSNIGLPPMLPGPYHVGYERDRARRRGAKSP